MASLSISKLSRCTQVSCCDHKGCFCCFPPNLASELWGRRPWVKLFIRQIPCDLPTGASRTVGMGVPISLEKQRLFSPLSAEGVLVDWVFCFRIHITLTALVCSRFAPFTLAWSSSNPGDKELLQMCPQSSRDLLFCLATVSDTSVSADIATHLLSPALLLCKVPVLIGEEDPLFCLSHRCLVIYKCFCIQSLLS